MAKNISVIYVSLKKEEKCNVDFALQQITSVYIYDLEALDDPYLRARAEDIRMLNRMLVNSIQGRVEPEIVLTSPSILVAESLSTNQLAAINAKQILGVVTAKGGKTDHIAILLKSMGIPALVGMGKAISTLKKESYLIIDCNQGMLLVNPIQEIVLQYELLKEKQFLYFLYYHYLVNFHLFPNMIRVTHDMIYLVFRR